jgi:hypothetical protein
MAFWVARPTKTLTVDVLLSELETFQPDGVPAIALSDGQTTV